MRTKSIFTTVLTAVLILSPLTGCSAAPQAQPPAASSPAPAAKDTLVLSIGDEPDTGFDPIIGWGRYGYPLFQSTLLRMNPDGSVGYDLATHYEVSDDGLTWTVAIREDARFSDGTPVQASDVAFTFRQAAQAAGVVDLSYLDDAVPSSASMVVFTLNRPSSIFIYRLMTLGIVPEKSYDKATYALSPIGSGPYKLESYEKGQKVVAVRNDLYYGQPAQFKRLVFLFTDEASRLAMARSGEIDVVSVPNHAAEETIPGMYLLNVDSVDNRGLSLPYVPNTGEKTANGYPIGNDVTAHLEIRQALNIGLDRDAIIQEVLNGFGDKAFTISSYLPWDNGYTVPDHDIEGAKRVLEQAGWKLNADGIYEKDGLKAEFSLIYLSSDSLRQAIALMVQQQAKEFGIKIDVVGGTWDDIAAQMASTPVVMGWGSLDPTEVFNIYATSMRGDGWYNPNYYSNDLVDAQFEQAIISRDYDNSLDHWKLAQDQITKDLPWVWLVNVSHPFYVNSCLDVGEQMAQPHAHGWMLVNNIEQWSWWCD